MAVQRYDRETLFFFAYHFNKNHRAIAVAWAVMSIVFCVLSCMAFSQPQWIGDTEESPGYGHMGVYAYCTPDSISAEYNCKGSFSSFDTILNDYFKATTVFMGLSALFMLIVCGALIMFFCFKKGYVFVICGTLQLLTGDFRTSNIVLCSRHNSLNHLMKTRNVADSRHIPKLPKLVSSPPTTFQ